MDALVRVVSPAKYRSWLKSQKTAIEDQNRQVTQLRQILTASNQLGS
jgi:heme/copper-type cytochrome/quinol oxidase subunit 2